MKVIARPALIAAVILSLSCSEQYMSISVQREPFGTANGKPVELFTLTNQSGMKVQITNYGGTIVSLWVPDKNGVLGDVVLGHDNLEGYLKASPYFGSTIGRYGNRIAQGRFTLDGVEYRLAQNNGANHLHGGVRGFDKQIWEAKARRGKNKAAIELSRVSPDGEEGYPGELYARVTFTLTDDNALQIDYLAKTNKPTVCNLTNHSYFNLRDGGASTILDHLLQIDADYYLPVDAGLIPVGKPAPVEGTPFDFRTPTRIGERIDQQDEQLANGGGYDHNWVLNGENGVLRRVATLSDTVSGRVMEIYTTEPGLQFYSGNFLDGTIKGKNGVVYAHRSGLCLETQHFPDSPNRPDFPSVVLRPGQVYRSTTIYKFLTN
ncbi:MAG: galactose mutarotase [candidate division KSB1 bacterium]|nr:galactose mutarotase [candidate division KSB1 bacterium]